MDVNIITSLIFSITGIIVSLICVTIPRARKNKIDALKRELLQVYKDVLALKEVEEDLEKQFNISKQTARKGKTISEKIETQRVKKRIQDLEYPLD
ncbi:MAG: hypothetical protein HUK18_05675 [Bacteroidales bacterium]|nr:hypothetical protein [Bacteroidales bacterium]